MEPGVWGPEAPWEEVLREEAERYRLVRVELIQNENVNETQKHNNLKVMLLF